MHNHPVPKADDPLTKKVQHEASFFKTLYVRKLFHWCHLSRMNFENVPPTNFGVFPDNGTEYCINYVALFATYMLEGYNYRTVLSCAPLPSEDNLSAENNKVLPDTLDVYEKTLGNVGCLISDTCAVNQKISSI